MKFQALLAGVGPAAARVFCWMRMDAWRKPAESQVTSGAEKLKPSGVAAVPCVTGGLVLLQKPQFFHRKGELRRC